MMLAELDRDARMQLMKFVCSFAWADLQISREERLFVAEYIRRLEFDQEERRLVWGWLDNPPDPGEVDPTGIPAEHRQLFVDTVTRLILADEHVADNERENLSLFEQLLQ